jgi:hypothetical protein
LTSEPDLNALGFDELDDLDRGTGDVGHVFPVREIAQEERGAHYDVDSVDAWGARCTPEQAFKVRMSDAPVSTVTRASSMLHRMCVRIFP